MSIDVTDCPRCHRDHGKVTFTQFTNPRPTRYDYFAICPVTVEPILVRFRDAAAPVEEFAWDTPS